MKARLRMNLEQALRFDETGGSRVVHFLSSEDKDGVVGDEARIVKK